MKDLSIIIVTYNTRDLTLTCINSIYENLKDKILYEVILVDNASTDGSRELFYEDKRIKYVYNSINYGFGRANNIGLEVSSGRNILFLNSDTVLFDDSIVKLMSFLDENEHVGAVGANLVDANKYPGTSMFRYEAGIFEPLNRMCGDIIEKVLFGKNRYYNYTSNPMRVLAISGADLCVKRHVLDEVGPFDENIFMYYEDIELCHRIRGGGYEIVSLPWVNIIHYGGGSGRENTHNEFNIIDEESTLYVLRKYHSEFYVSMYYRLMHISYVWKSMTRFNSSQSQRWAYLAQSQRRFNKEHKL